MWYLFFTFFVIKLCVNGHTVLDNGVLEDCCDEGTEYAQTHSLQECSLLNPPGENNKLYPASQCLEKMTQCCQNFHINNHGNSSTPVTINIAFDNSNLLNMLTRLLNNSNIVNQTDQPLVNTNFICPAGYVLQGNQCVDLDECKLIGSVFQSPCSQRGECINTVGSYRCRCHAGFTNPPLINTECVLNNNTCSGAVSPCQHICTDTQNGFQCSCVSGFRLNSDKRTCSSIDVECVQNVCQYQCRSIQGEQRCICPIGYELSNDGRSCVDINECSKRDDSYCSVGNNVHCFNNYGSSRCVDLNCPPNYALSDRSNNNYNHPWYGCSKTCTSSAECNKLPRIIWHDYYNFPSNQSSILESPFKVLLKNHYDVNHRWSTDVNVIADGVNVQEYRNHVSVVRDESSWRIYLVRRIEGPLDITFQVNIRDSASVIDTALNLHLAVSRYTFN